MYPARPGVTSLVSMPAYWARRVLPKEVFILYLRKTLCNRIANRTFMPKYIRNANAKYSSLIVFNAAYKSPIPTYQSNTANIATIAITCRKILKNRLEEEPCCFCPLGISLLDISADITYCKLYGLRKKTSIGSNIFR